MQNKAALGKRYTCFKCGCKFYDLNKPSPVCPQCGADQAEDPTPDPRVAVMAKYKAGSRPAAPKKKVDPYESELDDEEGPELDDDDDEETPADLEGEDMDDEG